MKTLPMPFIGPEVRALLREAEAPGTGKAQTRRVLKPQPSAAPRYMARVAGSQGWWEEYSETGHVAARHPLYAPGDLIWVRETWQTDHEYDWYAPADLPDLAGRFFPSTNSYFGPHPVSSFFAGKTRPSIHMPREFSRLTLAITDVRVEPLQDISAEDAIAEGLRCLSKDGKTYKYGIDDRDGLPGTDNEGWPWAEWMVDPREAYRKYWDSLNTKRGFGWDEELWVVIPDFTVHRQNIDAYLKEQAA